MENILAALDGVSTLMSLGDLVPTFDNNLPPVFIGFLSTGFFLTQFEPLDFETNYAEENQIGHPVYVCHQ